MKHLSLSMLLLIVFCTGVIKSIFASEEIKEENLPKFEDLNYSFKAIIPFDENIKLLSESSVIDLKDLRFLSSSKTPDKKIILLNNDVINKKCYLHIKDVFYKNKRVYFTAHHLVCKSKDNSINVFALSNGYLYDNKYINGIVTQLSKNKTQVSVDKYISGIIPEFKENTAKKKNKKPFKNNNDDIQNNPNLKKLTDHYIKQAEERENTFFTLPKGTEVNIGLDSLPTKKNIIKRNKL